MIPGSSAWLAIPGAHLAALHALTAKERLWQPDVPDVDTSVAAVIGAYGVYDWTRPTAHPGRRGLLEDRVVKKSSAAAPVFAEASPITHARADAPPFLLLHGHNDTVIPARQSRRLAERLRAVSKAPVVYAELPGAQHAFDVFASIRASACASAAEHFLDAVRANPQRLRRAAADADA